MSDSLATSEHRPSERYVRDHGWLANSASTSSDEVEPLEDHTFSSLSRHVHPPRNRTRGACVIEKVDDPEWGCDHNSVSAPQSLAIISMCQVCGLSLWTAPSLAKVWKGAPAVLIQ